MGAHDTDKHFESLADAVAGILERGRLTGVPGQQAGGVMTPFTTVGEQRRKPSCRQAKAERPRSFRFRSHAPWLTIIPGGWRDLGSFTVTNRVVGGANTDPGMRPFPGLELHSLRPTRTKSPPRHGKARNGVKDGRVANR